MSFLKDFTKIRCVTYKDDYSINKSSYNDLNISIEKEVVGCNSSVLGSKQTKQGDIVIITANKKSKRYFVIGIIQERLEKCDEWSVRGGNEWKFNFKIKIITPINEINKEFKNSLKKNCELENLNENHLFHSRFCGIRYKNVLINLIKEKIIICNSEIN
jgi:hypothetical protein